MGDISACSAPEGFRLAFDLQLVSCRLVQFEGPRASGADGIDFRWGLKA